MLVGLGLVLAVFLEERFRSRFLRVGIALYCGAAVVFALHIGPELRFAHMVTIPGQFGVTPSGDTVMIKGMDFSVATDSTAGGLFPLAALLWIALTPVVRGMRNEVEGREETRREPLPSAQT